MVESGTSLIVELLAALLTVVALGIPLSLPVAVGVLVTPRQQRRTAGPVIGGAFLVGLLLAVVVGLVGLARLPTAVEVGSALALVGGLVCTGIAAVLVLTRRADPGPAGPSGGAVLGVVGAALIGLAEPLQTLPAMFGLTRSAVVVFVAVVCEVVVILGLAGLLVMISRRFPGVRIGAAVGALAAGLLTVPGVLSLGLHDVLGVHLPGVPILLVLVGAVVAFVGGTLVGARRSRSPVAPAP
ncbi:hypothetical protein ACQBAU_13070 [Propionibacteriaceae bacterium Y2011]